MPEIKTKRKYVRKATPPPVGDSVPTPYSAFVPGDVFEINDPSAFYKPPKAGSLGVWEGWMQGGEKMGFARYTLVGPTLIVGNSLLYALYDPMDWVTNNAYYPSSGTALSRVTGPRAERVRSELRQWELIHNLTVRSEVACTSGCDPEIFAVDKFGEVIPAWKYLRSKEDGDVAYVDGFQAEFSTAPRTCCEELSNEVQKGLKQVYTRLLAHDPTAELTLRNVVHITPESMAEASDDQVALGCAPSLNAYSSEVSVGVGNPRALPFRFAGGHMHFGSRALHTDSEGYVKAIDAILGVASVGMFASFDNPTRRQYYGKAGEYRLPSHGLEYRVLSNAWLCHPAIYFWCFDMARGAMGLHKQKKMGYLSGYSEERVRGIINTCDVAGAREYVRENEGVYRGLANAYYSGRTKKGGDVSLAMIYGGVESVIAEPRNLVKNWNLISQWSVNGHGYSRHFYSLAENCTLVKSVGV